MTRSRKPHGSHRDDARTTWLPLPDDQAGRPADQAVSPSGISGSDFSGFEEEGAGAYAVMRLKEAAAAGAGASGALNSGSAGERAETLLETLAERDQETVGHLRRTAATVAAVAAALGWDEERSRWATYGALLHDIGKIGVARQVMYKPGPLTPEEQAVMRGHVDFGIDLVRAYGFPPIVARIVREHHERLDGSGYPQGLTGTQISEEARLVMLADIADAMLSRRSYKGALTMDDVRQALSAGAGSLLDADLVGPVVAALPALYPEG